MWWGLCLYFSFEHKTFEEYIEHLKGNIKQLVEYENLEFSGKVRAGDLYLGMID